MEYAARRFARWVLIIHLLLLATVMTLVYYAAREVYLSAKQQAIDQATKRQELLAEQTARGIESYYNSIFDNFDLLRRSEESDTTQPALPPDTAQRGGRRSDVARTMQLAPALWQQLRNRASHFLIVERIPTQPPRVILTLPVSEIQASQQIVDQTAAWLKTVDQPAVSKLLKLNDGNANLVCVPFNTDSRRLYVAVVPIDKIAEQFFHGINADPHMSAILLDEDMHVMVAFDKRILGMSVLDDSSNLHVKEIAEHYVKQGKAGTEVFTSGFQLGDHAFNSGIVSIQPIDLHGKRWWLSIGSDMSEVNDVVLTTFRRSLIWAIFVVVSMSAILVSTAIQMIRSRMRLERIQHDMLTRELTQARKIQLAWLPKNEDDPEHIDLTAVNKPASHISGDFYNWFTLPDGRLCVVIGDVMGHGMAAAFLMATTQLLVKMIMPLVKNAGRCLEEVNRQLCQQMFNGQFVTMLVLIVDRTNGQVEIAAAGHPPPLLGDDGNFKPLDLETHLVLGVEKGIKYPSQSFSLPSGAALVLYTDGVVEALGASNKQFSLQGLTTCLRGKYKNAQSIADCIVSAVDQFRGNKELLDDLTLVTILLEPVAKKPEANMARVEN